MIGTGPVVGVRLTSSSGLTNACRSEVMSTARRLPRPVCGMGFASEDQLHRALRMRQQAAQPLRLVLDPRVRITPAALTKLTALSMEMYDGAVAAHRAFLAAKELAQQVSGLTGAAADTLKADLEELAPTGLQRNLRAFRRLGGPATAPSLETVSNALQAAAMAMQSAESAPTAMQQAACDAARAQYVAVMARWRSAQARAATLRGSARP